MTGTPKKLVRSRWLKALRTLTEKQRASLPPMPDPEKEPAAFVVWMDRNTMTMEEQFAKWPEMKSIHGARSKNARARKVKRTATEAKYDAIYKLVEAEVQGSRPKWKTLAKKLADDHGTLIEPEHLRNLVRTRRGSV